MKTEDQHWSDCQAQHCVESQSPLSTTEKVPGPPFPPSGASKLSRGPSRNSTNCKSCELSQSGPYPYPVPGVGRTVQAILDDTGKDAEPALHALAQKNLAVFTDPLYSDLDVPDWVQRVSSKWKLSRPFTVSGLIKAIYDTSEALDLERGKVYVSAAICACANGAFEDSAEDAQPQLALARNLSRLASTWVAFFLWPFYGRTPDEPPNSDDTSGDTTPTAFMNDVTRMSDGINSNRSGMFRDDVIRRDGRKCIVTGDSDPDDENVPEPPPPGVFLSYLRVAHLFSPSVVACGEVGHPKSRSTAVTFEILRHFCQLSDRYLKDTEFVETPENAFTIAGWLRTPFEHLTWCLIPTTTPNVYQFKDYCPALSQLRATPSLITFKDHSVASDSQPLHPSPLQTLGKRTRDQRGVDLPSPELIRLHAALVGVLNMSGAAGLFKIIAGRHRCGGPPAPSADGEAFWREVVDGQVLDDLRESVVPSGLVLPSRMVSSERSNENLKCVCIPS